MGLCYVSLVEPRVDGNTDLDPVAVKDSLVPFRQAYRGTLIVAGGYKNAASGGDAVASGHCDLVCYGRHYLANPDLVSPHAGGRDRVVGGHVEPGCNKNGFQYTDAEGCD